MMFERFTDDARTVVRHASEHARRLGHRYIGSEHLLLAAVSAGQPASAVMRAHGVTPELVEEEIVRRVGLGAGAGPQALSTAARAVHRDPRRRPGLRPEAGGRYCAPGAPRGRHIPFTPAAKKILELSLRETLALHDPHIGVEHIALALTCVGKGMVPPILSAAGTSAPALRAAILDRYRQAG